MPYYDFSMGRQWQHTPELLPGKSHGRRSLVGCSPWGCEEVDTAEQLHFQFSLSCIGEGNGNPLQWSCLENPRTGEPGGLPSMGSQRVRHDWNDLAAAAAWFLKHIPQHIQPNLKVTVIEFRTISGQQRPNELERTSWDSLQDIYFSPTYVCKVTIFLHYLTNSLC